jgi:hypothetical protein
MTSLISAQVAQHWKLLPILAILFTWFFFSGFRTILRNRRDRLFREFLHCVSSLGLLLSLLSFACYGLLDPANHLARTGALPVATDVLSHLEAMAYGSALFAVLAGIALEVRLRGDKLGI